MFSGLWARASLPRGISLKDPGAFHLFILSPSPALSHDIPFQIPNLSLWTCGLYHLSYIMQHGITYLQNDIVVDVIVSLPNQPFVRLSNMELRVLKC
jgi:hypothetical protein